MSCSQKVVRACCGSKARTSWWIPSVKEAVRQNKKAFQAWLTWKSPEAADGLQRARKLRRILSSGKALHMSGRESTACLTLCSAGEENLSL